MPNGVVRHIIPNDNRSVYMEKNIMRAKGIDISHWQGSFHFNDNIDFIIIKATEGAGWVDPEFENNWPEVEKVPIRGAYHYYRTEYDSIIQAEHFWNTVKDKDLHFLAVDYEAKNNTLDRAGAEGLLEFYDHLYALSYMEPILYTSPYIFRDNLCIWNTAWLNVPLWMAHYTYEDPENSSPLVFDALGWILWQYTSDYNGRLYGVESENVDQNVYNGIVKQMNEWLLPQEEIEMNKNWFSKTTLFSILFILVNIAGIWGYGDFTPSPELVQYAGIAVSVIGAIVGVVVKYFENKN